MVSVPLLQLVNAGLGRLVTLSASERPLRAALICSLSLFAGGGVMGFMIRGSNTVIPAHYHGSIVGVTLAYMGVVYLLLPRLGHPLTMPRTAFWQPYVYGIGQVMHVTALALTGGPTAPRKTAGVPPGGGTAPGRPRRGAGGSSLKNSHPRRASYRLVCRCPRL